MNRRKLVLLILSFVSLVAYPQAPIVTPSPNLDIYANFVGDWVGTVAHSKNGVIVDKPVELKVTESPKKDSMRFDYTSAKKADSNFQNFSRTITLDPKTSKMTSKYKGDKKHADEVVGLAKFAETGHGIFVASRIERSSTYPFYRCTFN